MATKKKKAVKKKATKKKAEVKKLSRKEGTIGFVIMKMIKDKSTNEEVLKAVTKKFPDCKTTIASISWYRNRMRQSSPSIPTNRALIKKEK